MSSFPAGVSPVYAVQSSPTMVDFPERLAALLFVSGCNFRCGFCHNANLLGRPRNGYGWEKLAGILDGFREKQWVGAAVLTGGEPSLAPNLMETIRFIRSRGFVLKLDSNGGRPEVLAQALPEVEYVAMDIKHAPERYPDFVSFAHVDRIRQSIDLLLTGAVDYEFRTTLIEGVHDDDSLHAMGRAIRGAKLHILQPFVPRDDLPDPALAKLPRCSPQRLQQAADILKDYVCEVRIRGKDK